ncbi:GAP family protein [Rubrobacter tropicus]|uniref:GAP family protein n=1 Tax=Rubrobacter tropicus TaxID=2653851 RepID=UPI00140E8AE7|nr:GAP family protein [Rubrobacter tropicus]
MTALLLSLLGLALLDSINPSALAVTVYLILQGRPYGSRVLTYVSAVFASYLAIGVLLMFGLGSVWGYVEGPAADAAQGVAGALLLGYALLAPNKPRRNKTRTPRSRGLAGIFLLGVTVTAVEFTTAFPYLGAIALLTDADLAAARWLPILVVYNVIFVLPPLLLMVAYGVFGTRVRDRLERLRERFEGGSRETLLWILGIVGFFLLSDSLAGLGFFGLVEIPDTPRGS